MSKLVCCWAIVALAMCCGAARAENPQVSLKLENVTVAQACQRLQEAAHITVEPGNIAVGDNTMVKASFNWTDTSFAGALRQLCQKFSLRPQKKAEGGYVLYESFQAAQQGPARTASSVTRSGVRLSVIGVSLSENRNLSFHPTVPEYTTSSLGLTLSAILSQGDAETVAGVQDLVAQDDLGGFLTNPGLLASPYNNSSTIYPDEWSGGVYFASPNPKARRLRWVEGDMMVFRSVRTQHAEAEMPLKESVVSVKAGEATFVLSRYRVLPKPDTNDDKNLPGLAIPAQVDWGPTLRVRLYTRNDVQYRPANGGYELAPTVVGKSGKKYLGVLIRGGGSYSDAEKTARDGIYLFPGVEEEITRIFWDFQEKSHPEKLFSFRLTDIPFPDAAPAPPAGNAPAPQDAPSNRPFYEKGGGTLVFSVQMQGKTVADGSVRLGLAQQTTEGWGPVRWLEAVVGSDGTVRLEDLKPGAYRLLRTFTPHVAPAVDLAKGHWSGGELKVQVTAGKELIAEPLRWDPGIAPKPAVLKPAGAAANKR